MSRDIDWLAAELVDMREQIRSLSTPQLAHSAIVDGAIDQVETVDTGTVDEFGMPIYEARPVARIGAQPDGSNTIVSLDGPTPPTPTEPTVTPGPGFLVVGWDGRFEGGAPATLDFDHVEVHVGTASQVMPSPETLRGTIATTEGAEVVVGSLDPGSYYVSLVARSRAGKASDPAAYGVGGPGDAASAVDVQRALTAAQAAEVAALDAQAIARSLDASLTAAQQQLAVAQADLATAAASVAKATADAAAATAQAAAAQAAADNAAAQVSGYDARISDAVKTAQAASRITYAGAAPAADAPGKSGDSWLVRDGSGVVTGQWHHDGTGWVQDAVSGTVLAADSVSAAQIAAGAITTSELAAGSVTAGNIVAGEIGTQHLTAGAVTTAKLAAGAVTANELAAGSVVAAKIAADAVTAASIAAGAITTAKLAAGSVTTNELAAGAVTAAKIAANAVTANSILAGSVTAAKIAANTITAAEIASSAITADELAAGSVAAGHIVAGAVTAQKLESALVLGTRIIAGNPNAARVELNSTGLTGYDDDGASTVALTPSGDNFLVLRDATGTPVASIGATGQVAGSLGDFYDINFSGRPLWTHFWPLSSGTNASAIGQDKTVNGVNAEIGLGEVSFVAINRTYRITWGGCHWSLPSGSAVPTSVIFRLRYTTDGTAPKVSSPILDTSISVATVAGVAITAPPMMVAVSDLPNNFNTIRVMVTAQKLSGTGTPNLATYSSTGTQAKAWRLWVEDVGANVVETWVDNDGSGSAAAKTTRTTTWVATDSGTYSPTSTPSSGGKANLKQATSTQGVVILPDMTGTLAGVTIQKLEVYVYASTWAKASGGIARVMVHGATALGSSAPTLTAAATSGSASAPWPKATGRWVTLDPSLHAGFKSGTYRGFAIGPAPSSDSIYTGTFLGASTTSAQYQPQFRATYTK